MAPKRKGSPLRRPHGGVRQRMERREAEVRASLAPSALVTHLVELWSWGLISPQTLQQIVSKARDDMLAYAGGTLDFSEVEHLASIGADGQASQNCLRDLERRLSKPNLAGARYSFDCVMRSPLSRLVLNTHQQDVILPHEIFHILYKDHRADFFKKFVGPEGVLEGFWQAQEGSPLLHEHPLLSRPNWQKKTIPLAVHGDATPVSGLGKSWGKQLDVYSFFSLLAHGSTRDLMILMYTGFQHLMTKNSMRTVWQILAWSFEALANGRFPQVDPFGVPYPEGSIGRDRANLPLADGFCGVVWCIQGDLDYFAKNLWLRHWSSGHPCCFCPCNKVEGDGMCWSEFRTGQAEWQQECWTNNEWKEAHLDRHPLLSLDGVGIENVFPDHMHVKHLGCDKYNYASVIHLLCFELMPDDPATNLDVVWAEIVEYCKAHGITDRYRHMKMGLCWKPRAPHASFPKMRGKAIEVRNLGEPLLSVWTSKMDRSNTLHQQVAFMLRCSVKMETMLKENREFFRYPPALASEYLQTAEKYLQLTSSIARQYNESGKRLFDLTTKHHILWHCAKSAAVLNPAKSWCYMGEDNMQHVRRLASSCLAGTKQWCVGPKVLRKWSRGFALRFLPRSGWFGLQ